MLRMKLIYMLIIASNIILIAIAIIFFTFFSSGFCTQKAQGVEVHLDKKTVKTILNCLEEDTRRNCTKRVNSQNQNNSDEQRSSELEEKETMKSSTSGSVENDDSRSYSMENVSRMNETERTENHSAKSEGNYESKSTEENHHSKSSEQNHDSGAEKENYDSQQMEINKRPKTEEENRNCSVFHKSSLPVSDTFQGTTLNNSKSRNFDSNSRDSSKNSDSSNSEEENHSLVASREKNPSRTEENRNHGYESNNRGLEQNKENMNRNRDSELKYGNEKIIPQVKGDGPKATKQNSKSEIAEESHDLVETHKNHDFSRKDQYSKNPDDKNQDLASETSRGKLIVENNSETATKGRKPESLNHDSTEKDYGSDKDPFAKSSEESAKASPIRLNKHSGSESRRKSCTCESSDERNSREMDDESSDNKSTDERSSDSEMVSRNNDRSKNRDNSDSRISNLMSEETVKNHPKAQQNPGIRKSSQKEQSHSGGVSGRSSTSASDSDSASKERPNSAHSSKSSIDEPLPSGSTESDVNNNEEKESRNEKQFQLETASQTDRKPMAAEHYNIMLKSEGADNPKTDYKNPSTRNFHPTPELKHFSRDPAAQIPEKLGDKKSEEETTGQYEDNELPFVKSEIFSHSDAEVHPAKVVISLSDVARTIFEVANEKVGDVNSRYLEDSGNSHGIPNTALVTNHPEPVGAVESENAKSQEKGISKNPENQSSVQNFNFIQTAQDGEYHDGALKQPDDAYPKSEESLSEQGTIRNSVDNGEGRAKDPEDSGFDKEIADPDRHRFTIRNTISRHSDLTDSLQALVPCCKLQSGTEGGSPEKIQQDNLLEYLNALNKIYYQQWLPEKQEYDEYLKTIQRLYDEANLKAYLRNNNSGTTSSNYLKETWKKRENGYAGHTRIYSISKPENPENDINPEFSTSSSSNQKPENYVETKTAVKNDNDSGVEIQAAGLPTDCSLPNLSSCNKYPDQNSWNPATPAGNVPFSIAVPDTENQVAGSTVHISGLSGSENATESIGATNEQIRNLNEIESREAQGQNYYVDTKSEEVEEAEFTDPEDNIPPTNKTGSAEETKNCNITQEQQPIEGLVQEASKNPESLNEISANNNDQWMKPGQDELWRNTEFREFGGMSLPAGFKTFLEYENPEATSQLHVVNNSQEMVYEEYSGNIVEQNAKPDESGSPAEVNSTGKPVEQPVAELDSKELKSQTGRSREDVEKQNTEIATAPANNSRIQKHSILDVIRCCASNAKRKISAASPIILDSLLKQWRKRFLIPKIVVEKVSRSSENGKENAGTDARSATMLDVTIQKMDVYPEGKEDPEEREQSPNSSCSKESDYFPTERCRTWKAAGYCYTHEATKTVYCRRTCCNQLYLRIF